MLLYGPTGRCEMAYVAPFSKCDHPLERINWPAHAVCLPMRYAVCYTVKTKIGLFQ